VTFFGASGGRYRYIFHMIAQQRKNSRAAPGARRCSALLMSALALPACLAGPALASDQVYKSIDADGHVVYSDRASTPAAEKTDIHVNRPDAAEVAQYAKEQQILKAEDDQRRKQFAAEAADAQKKSQAEHARETQCENARSRNDAIQGGRRIYSNDADGNRVYLSGEDAETKREEARQAVAAACGS